MKIVETPWDSISKQESKLNTKAVSGNSSGHWFWVRLSTNSFGVAYRYEKSNRPVEGFFKATSEIRFVVVPELNEKEYLCILIESSELSLIFNHLCFDLMDSCKDIDSASEIFFLISNRVKSWQRLFRKGVKQLSQNEILGLIAELKFLTDYWFSVSSTGIEGWVGPLDAPQDFLDEHNDFAVEVKAYSPERQKIQISSLEQLDFGGKLFLAAFPINQSDKDGALTLNEFVAECRSKLPADIIQLFEGRLIEAGYVEDPYYDELTFYIEEITVFEISEQFPCLRTSKINIAISKAQYQLDINCLSSHRVTQEYLLQEAPDDR